MAWRALRPEEHWDWEDEDEYVSGLWPPGWFFDGPDKGYAVDSLIFLYGHQNCECHREQHAERVTWFLQHDEEYHGMFPMDFLTYQHMSQNGRDIAHARLIAQLRDQIGSLRNGFIVQLDNIVMFGEILHWATA
jgi:hypothetical protein